MVRFLGRLPIKIVEYSEYIDGAPSEGTVPAGSGPHSPIWPHSLACWSIKLQNSIVAAAELQLSAYMHRGVTSRSSYFGGFLGFLFGVSYFFIGAWCVFSF